MEGDLRFSVFRKGRWVFPKIGGTPKMDGL